MIYAFLAEGFEEAEAILPLDLLIRAGLEIQTVSITNDRPVIGTHGIPVMADRTAADFPALPEDAEMILLPGGMPGTQNLYESPLVQVCIRQAAERKLPLAAICAAPSVYGRMGLLEGKRATCFPGFEDMLLGAEATGEGLTVDGSVITARALGSAHDFAFAIIRMLKDAETAERVRNSIFFEA